MENNDVIMTSMPNRKPGNDNAVLKKMWILSMGFNVLFLLAGSILLQVESIIGDIILEWSRPAVGGRWGGGRGRYFI